MHERADKRFPLSTLWIGLALVAGVVAIYGQTLAFEFVGFDDDLYVFQNWVVRQGLTFEGLRLAFSRSELLGTGFPPHPLTWLSHMLDVEIFGLAAGGHHATSVALHALNGALLFAALRALTGATWRSAAAAALWAWHPLRVESVAWVSERKDVLSGAFAILTLLCYARYVRGASRAAWWGTILCFALGLMSKPTLVPLPFALLLLDHWPLARRDSYARLLVEKWPLFALSLLSSLLTLTDVYGVSIWVVSPEHRAANGVVALARYVGYVVWPHPLAPLYLHPYLSAQGGVPLAALTIAAASAIGIGITLVVLRARRKPYLAVGWLWFLGMLVPTIGVFHVGYQALADRYTYLPMIGLSVAFVWGIADLLARARPPALRRALLAVGACTLAAYGAAAFAQARIWRNSETLYRRTLEVSPRSTLMHFNLASWLRLRNDFDGAIQHYQAGLAIDPVADGMVHFDYGRALHAQGHIAEAIEQYRAAAESDPPDKRAALQLGLTFELQGRLAEAIDQYRRAIEIDPATPKPRQRLAAAMARKGSR